MHSRARRRRAVSIALFVAAGAAATAQIERPDSLMRVQRSTDVAWLERVAASAAFARDVQRSGVTVMPKQLRVAAFARLGEIGSAQSLAAIARIESEMAGRTLTPPTLPLDSWPSLGSHMSDSAPRPLALAPPRDGVTYAVVSGNFLGGSDYFLLSSKTPRDAASWSRPKLIGPMPRDTDDSHATLVWRGPRMLVLSVASRTTQIAIDEIERDSDGDGWTDLEEARLGTNPHAVDSDDDGIPDGRDVCPLYAAPRDRDEGADILQAAIFGGFAMTGARQLLYVTPQTPHVQLSGYGGPVIFDRAIPATGDGGGATYVGWKIARRTADEATVALTDWEGMLAAGGQEITLKRTAARWIVVAVRSTWVS